jgi:hypothetical protein
MFSILRVLRILAKAGGIQHKIVATWSKRNDCLCHDHMKDRQRVTVFVTDLEHLACGAEQHKDMTDTNSIPQN